MGALVHFPVRPLPMPDETVASHLTRLADANGMLRPEFVRRLVATGSLAFLDIAPAPGVAQALGVTDVGPAVLGGLAGVDVTGLVADDRRTWREVAARGWAPRRGSALCPMCFREDGAWRTTWRHPWVACCTRHGVWLVACCPSCQRPFRNGRHSPLPTIDATLGQCGNPAGRRGSVCQQALAEIPTMSASALVLTSQARIHAAVHHGPMNVFGKPIPAATFLAELRALTVLVLHLARQDGGDAMASWAGAARLDHRRSGGDRGARWGLAPPSDPQLRGHALTAADTILGAPDFDAAAGLFASWLCLVPHRSDGELGWLADHTVMTPLLTRLVMQATSPRRRLSTHLRDGDPMSITRVPQVLPADIYARSLGGMVSAGERTGRLFASLCIARLGRPDLTWRGAAEHLGLSGELGNEAAHATIRSLHQGAQEVVAAIEEAAADLLGIDVDYRRREAAVRRLACRTRWYRTWTRHHHRGSHRSSQRYAVTWLWTEYAGGHLDTSPGWDHPPGHRERAYHHRYAARLDHAAKEALIALARTAQGADS